MLLLVGKMASGKDTLKKELINMGMESIVTYTTRPPRPDEINGISYHFISKEEFLQKEKQGFFAETTSYDVATGDTWYYGSALDDLTDDKVIIVNPQGLYQLKKVKSLNLVSFYIMADQGIRFNRALKRQDHVNEINRRINVDEYDFVNIEQEVDFIIKSDIGLNPHILAEIIIYSYKKMEMKNI